MVRKDSKTENHHYVPKMLLRNFSRVEKEDQIFVFDKQSEKSFPTNIKNVVSERGFYDFEDDAIAISLEPALSKLEAETAQAFAKLIHARNLNILTEQDKAWISTFIASQHVRVKNFREVMKDFDAQMNKKIRALGGDPENVKGFRAFKDDEEIKKFSVYFLVKSLPEFSSLINEKTWMLMSTNEDNPFWISDNPVTMHNDLDFGPYGNIGLGAKGIQIHLPLTPTLTLALWCPSFSNQFIEAFDNSKNTRKFLETQKVVGRNPNVEMIDDQIRQLDAAAGRLSKLVTPMKEGTPMKASEDNMLFFNSLQARWADRFVMSSKNDFAMVDRMLKDFPDSKRGVRMTLG